jgi:hypothetical protein
LVKPKHVAAFVVNFNVSFNILKQFDCALVGQIKDLTTIFLFLRTAGNFFTRLVIIADFEIGLGSVLENFRPYRCSVQREEFS